MDRIRRTAALYFAVQAVAVAAWWWALMAYPSLRPLFQTGTDESALLAFWLPDVLLLVGGSAMVAALALRRHPLAPAAAALTAGAAIYATLYCLSAALMTDLGWWSVAAMFPAALLSSVFAVVVTPAALAALRPAPRRARPANVARTGAQIVVFWGMLLLVVPLLLVALEDELGMPRLAFDGQWLIGGVAFATASLLGLWSGWTMTTQGDGTPLPTDAPRRLVVHGPYAHVRNPMALAGLGQGLAVALLAGSATVAAYALLGTALWQYVARPLEEEDLALRFGGDYERYRAVVRCWVPRRSPYGTGSLTLPHPT